MIQKEKKKKKRLLSPSSQYLAGNCASPCDSPKRHNKYARVLNMLSVLKIESQVLKKE
jgi:hypothetical protein